jgi:alkylation response protein AidB-like acyl-CoA dehydrogenase
MADGETAGGNRSREAAMVGRLIQTARSAYQYLLIFKQLWHTPRVQAQGQEIVYRHLERFTTSTQAMMLRLAQLQDEGVMRDEHASLAKAFCTVKCRETVGYARELLGGNGILLENHIGRFVADAEAIYSYEGTREMNTLIVGKSITGLSAFV